MKTISQKLKTVLLLAVVPALLVSVFGCAHAQNSAAKAKLQAKAKTKAKPKVKPKSVVAVKPMSATAIRYRLPATGPLPRTYRVTLAITDAKNPNWIVSTFLSGAAREVTAANGTKWNRGSVNPQMLTFLEWYLATSTPVRQLERLGNVGLAHITDKVATGGYALSELFQLPRDLDG